MLLFQKSSIRRTVSKKKPDCEGLEKPGYFIELLTLSQCISTAKTVCFYSRYSNLHLQAVIMLFYFLVIDLFYWTIQTIHL